VGRELTLQHSPQTPLAGGHGANMKIVATRCQILRLNAPNSISAGGSTPDPAGGDYSTTPDHLPGGRALTFKLLPLDVRF